MDADRAREQLETYLQQLIATAGFELQYTLAVRPGDPSPTAPPPASPGESKPTSASEPPAGPEAVPASSSPAEPASPPGAAPVIEVHFSGADAPLLTARNAELLHAIESMAASILRLEPDEHHHLQFDADEFRATRARSLEQAVEEACARILTTGRPHPFPPMNSRERRLIHLTAARLGIQTASSGEGPRRSVVLYPPGHPTAAQPPLTLPGEQRSRSAWERRGGRPSFGGDPSFARDRDQGREARRSGSPSSQDRPFPARASLPEGRPGVAAPPPSGGADYDPQLASPGEPVNTTPEAERIRAIRERFRKR